MYFALGIEVQGEGERLGTLFVGDDAVQARVLYELVGLEGWEINLAHEGEEGRLALGGKDESRII